MPKRPSQAAMLRQIQKMQDDMSSAQQALEHETVEVSVGGGLVTVVMTGHQRVQSVGIDHSLIDLEDEEWLEDLQDLLLAAMNQAVEQSQLLAAQRMESITGGLGDLPGMGGLLG
ncbi:MAG: YbaB/EbfC family nucleoid-associated protein [Anaerolineaceae bacterium]|nr:YbaB/EbfC family nucleoid-associated protein [Anaerolineaceae bacterium]